MSIIEMLASALILAGVYYYGKRMTAGPVFSALGCLLWIAVGVMQDMYALCFLNAVLFVVNAYNAALWISGQSHIVFTEEREENVETLQRKPF